MRLIERCVPMWDNIHWDSEALFKRMKHIQFSCNSLPNPFIRITWKASLSWHYLHVLKLQRNISISRERPLSFSWRLQIEKFLLFGGVSLRHSLKVFGKVMKDTLSKFKSCPLLIDLESLREHFSVCPLETSGSLFFLVTSSCCV